jgi:hypothetical protein
MSAEQRRQSSGIISPMTDWRPMAVFDPDKPALVHDRLNDQVIAWKPERHGRDYRAGHRDFGGGVIEWDGLLLDGWKEAR